MNWYVDGTPGGNSTVGTISTQGLYTPPHTVGAHVQERFTRTDHNNLEVTITLDDPKLYTKPFSLGTVYFRWIPNQIFDEKPCIPSETIEYLKSVGDPAGTSVSTK